MNVSLEPSERHGCIVRAERDFWVDEVIRKTRTLVLPWFEFDIFSHLEWAVQTRRISSLVGVDRRTDEVLSPATCLTLGWEPLMTWESREKGNTVSTIEDYDPEKHIATCVTRATQDITSWSILTTPEKTSLSLESWLKANFDIAKMISVSRAIEVRQTSRGDFGVYATQDIPPCTPIEVSLCIVGPYTNPIKRFAYGADTHEHLSFVWLGNASIFNDAGDEANTFFTIEIDDEDGMSLRPMGTITFFTKQFIYKGQELTIDYGDWQREVHCDYELPA